MRLARPGGSLGVRSMRAEGFGNASSLGATQGEARDDLRRNFVEGTAWDDGGPHTVRIGSAFGPALRRFRVAFGSDLVRLCATWSGCSPHAERFRYGSGLGGTDAARIRSGCGPQAGPSTLPPRVGIDGSRPEFVGLETSTRANTEGGGECRDRRGGAGV